MLRPPCVFQYVTKAPSRILCCVSGKYFASRVFTGSAGLKGSSFSRPAVTTLPKAPRSTSYCVPAFSGWCSKRLRSKYCTTSGCVPPLAHRLNELLHNGVAELSAAAILGPEVEERAAQSVPRGREPLHARLVWVRHRPRQQDGRGRLMNRPCRYSRAPCQGR